jgi:hypothetical protein
VFTPAVPRAPSKLRLGVPGDALEREADRVADRVLTEPRLPSLAAAPSEGVQRKCAACEDELVQRAPSASPSLAAPPGFDGAMSALSNAGQPLPAGERRFFESRFGVDFSGVRVHAGGAADGLARSIGARAFTLGNDVVLRSGELRHGTPQGRRLMAHELTHVVQQRRSRSGVVQRDMTLQSPGSPEPLPAGFVGPPRTRAMVLQEWLNELCAQGGWTVNETTGVVAAASRATFCAARPRAGSEHRSTAGTPVGCQCLCDATGPGSKTIAVQIDQSITFTIGGVARSVALTATGGAATAHVAANDKVVASRGFGFAAITGAGDTNPDAAGTGARDQALRTPPWLAFGHELCGHALPQATVTREEHMTTRQGNRSAIDIENRLRREHSTVADSLGMRRGEFLARNAGGVMAPFVGGVYQVVAGETLSGIAVRVGIPLADMRNHIWRFNGDRITVATQNTIRAGERLLIEGIDWHHVIAGETLTSIAGFWNTTVAALRRANPRFAASSTIRVGDRLLIPVR